MKSSKVAEISIEPTDTVEQKDECLIVTFPKPPQDKFGASAKIVRMRTIFNFVAKVRGYEINEDEVVIQLISPDDGKDMEGAKWFRDNVIRYVDIDKDANDRVDKLIAAYDEHDPKHEHPVTVDLIRLQSQEIYVPISIWKVEP